MTDAEASVAFLRALRGILLEALYARIMSLPERSVQRARLEERARLIRHGMLG